MKPAKTIKNSVRQVRCAIYTRKSSEEGLDMEFNSLDAQREACASYIASQKAEGWVVCPNRYDDGGISGGTLERPALQRLLRDVENRLIDIIVVYKVDRLSRSLLDFSKLVETFERCNVSFVSITQQFNTTSSMGRLTLNILLSFAQFEREVIGERIRDKFAASRRKGMWMGGVPPLGYDVVNRKLLINQSEADLVRLIFHRFVELGSITALMHELAESGHRAKSWTTQEGKERQGGPLDRKAIYGLLANRIYLGEAVHKGVSYPGEHEAIIDTKTWDKAHTILKENFRERPSRQTVDTPALLKGILFGPNGDAMTPVFTRKQGKMYRYYVSQTAIRSGYEACPLRTIPAGEIETAVTTQLRSLLRAPEIIIRTWRQTTTQNENKVSEREITTALRNLDPLWDELFPAEQARLIRLLVARATIDSTGVRIDLRADGLATLAADLRPTFTQETRA
ncbi:site-specific DNA recombinase [Azospirillaceae bacterium]